MIDELLAQIKEEYDKKESGYELGIINAYSTVLCHWRDLFEKEMKEQKETGKVVMSEHTRGILSAADLLESQYSEIINKHFPEEGN